MLMLYSSKNSYRLNHKFCILVVALATLMACVSGLDPHQRHAIDKHWGWEFADDTKTNKIRWINHVLKLPIKKGSCVKMEIGRMSVDKAQPLWAMSGTNTRLNFLSIQDFEKVVTSRLKLKKPEQKWESFCFAVKPMKPITWFQSRQPTSQWSKDIGQRYPKGWICS